MNWAERRRRWLNWREWELNPVVVKELRQAVRSWAVTGMLMLFLVVLFVVALMFLVGQSLVFGVSRQLGSNLFQGFIAILTAASVGFIPLYVGVRLAAERQEGNLDLLYVSTLSPGRIIRGKFFCGVYMTLLFFSACMPFMAFTNLLRGIDLPTIFFILLCLFAVVCLVLLAAICLSCLQISRTFRILLALFGTLALFFIVTPMVVFSWETMRSGIGATMGRRDFWQTLGGMSLLGLAVGLLLYLVAVALISPSSSNRALPLRVFLSICWGLGIVASFVLFRRFGSPNVPMIFFQFTLVGLVISLLVIVSNRDELSHRVRRTIPTQPFKRVLAFLFYHGAAGGIVWAMLLSTASFACFWGALEFGPRFFKQMRTTPVNANWVVSSGAILAYAFAFALTGLWLHRTFFPKKAPKLAGVIAVLLPGAWAVVPNLVLFFMNKLSWQTLEQLQLGNVFNVFVLSDDSLLYDHLVFAGGWCLIAMLLNGRWFHRQAMGFQPIPQGAQAGVATPQLASSGNPTPLPS